MESKDNIKQQTSGAEKPGLFKRIFTKMDDAMKAKADDAAKTSCCSDDKSGKGGKCC